MNPSQVSVPYVNAAESASYHNIKYPTLRQMSNYRFDKSTLRHLSKIPRINSAPTVRIAPPEPISMNLFSDKYISNNDRHREEVKSDNYIQVLKDFSRKRNYAQEETDRVDSIPKKSRRNDIKNLMTPHYKRSYDDSSNDNLEDTTRKKRCSDSDRSVAKMMSYTSSMSVLADDFSWTNRSKKRKCSKIEKSKNESPENVEKLRKIAIEECNGDVIKHIDEQRPKNSTYVVKQHISPMQHDEPSEAQVTTDEIDSRSAYEPPLPDDDGEYIRVVSGKILNRTNCTYRKKLNSSKINPESVISIEPELVNGSSHEDDDAMKENLLKNLIDDIERKGEKNESVIFYENSIVEEIAKNQNQAKAEAAKSEKPVVSSFNPLLSQTTIVDTESKPTFNSAIMSTPSVQSQPVPKQLYSSDNPLLKMATTNISTNFNSSTANNSAPTLNSGLANNTSFNINSSTTSTSNFNTNTTSNSLTFGNAAVGVDTVDVAKKSDSPKPEQKKEEVSKTASNITSPITSTETVSCPSDVTIAASSPKNNFLFPCVVSMAPSNMSFGLTTSVNSASFHTSVSSPQQSNSVVSTTSIAQPAMPNLTFGDGSPLKFGAGQSTNSNPPKSDSSSTLQFGNVFNQPKPAEEKNNLSQITMFGNTAMSTTNSPVSTTNVFTATTTASSLTSTAQKPSGGFQFGQSIPASSTSGGFSFGAGTSNNSGFKLGATTTSTPPAFSVSSTFSSSSVPSFNTTSAPSFSVASAPSFGSLKFGSETTPLFGAVTSSFSATTATTCSSSVPTFGGAQNTTFGMASGGFSNSNQPQTNPTFSMSSSQPQTTLSFGNINKPSQQSMPTFGINAPTQSTPSFGNTNAVAQSNPAFGNTNAVTQSNPAFGNSNTAAQPTSAFGNANTAQSTSAFGNANTTIQTIPAFGNTNTQPQSTSSFGNSSTTSQVAPTFGNQTTAFGNTPNTMFGSGDASVFAQNTTSQFGASNTQPTPQFGNSGGFTFGSNTANAPSAFGNTSTAPTPFGNTGTTQQSTFNAAPTFNFNSGSSSFGGGAVFGAPAAPRPAENAFTFGNAAQVGQPAQNSVFQFGNSAPAQSNQPFNFAAAPASATASGGGFSIGSGGASRNSRSNRSTRRK